MTDMDEFVQKLLEDPKNQQIVKDAQDFGELKEMKGWQRLRARVTADRDRYTEGIAKRLLGGEIVDQREIDFHRGFYAACNYVTGIPEVVEDNLARTARMAYALSLAEQEQESLEDSPYLIGA